MYQRPNYHWKLECEAQYTVDAALKELQSTANEESIYEKMHNNYRPWGVAAVVLYCLTVLFPPAGVIIGSCMLIKPLMVTLDVNEALNTRTVYDLPSWINDCSAID